MGNRDHMRPACLAQRPDGMPRICSKFRDHVGPHSWEEVPDTEADMAYWEARVRAMDLAVNPIIVTKPADDLDMTPGSVHSVGEPEPEPVSWWKRWWGETVLRTQSWVFDVIFLTAYGFAFFALGRLTA